MPFVCLYVLFSLKMYFFSTNHKKIKLNYATNKVGNKKLYIQGVNHRYR